MNGDNEKVLQQSVLLIYTVLPKILSPKPRQHARKTVGVFKDEETEEREGEKRKEGRERNLPLVRWYIGEIVSSKMKKACIFCFLFFSRKKPSSEFHVGLENILGTRLLSGLGE